VNRFKYVLINIFETLLRVFPFPCRRGLIKIGNPGRHSPVLITGNFHLTVQRVKKSLHGLDVYLLVANSRGINVWCAAAGGHLTNRDVISVLKTSGIEKLVDHRRVILPQLAATGIEGRVIARKTGWKVVWGPVYARDIPEFLQARFQKTPAMSQVKFPLLQRMEMAVAWAFPISLVADLIVLPFRKGTILPLTLLVWLLAFFIFITFPLYEKWLRFQGKRVGFIFFDFGRGGFQLIMWGLFILGLIGYALFSQQYAWNFVVRWGFISLVIILTLSLDLAGSTPVLKSGLHAERLLNVVLDEARCRGAAFCERVCPRNCFEVDKTRHKATRPRENDCVRCGACIVQCPFDALFFADPEGKFIPPEVTRKFKINLMGKRLVKPAGAR